MIIIRCSGSIKNVHSQINYKIKILLFYFIDFTLLLNLIFFLQMDNQSCVFSTINIIYFKVHIFFIIVYLYT